MHLVFQTPYETYVERFTIDMADWTLVSRTPLREPNPDAVEMSNINYAYNGQPYQWAYMAKNLWLTDSEILKVRQQCSK